MKKILHISIFTTFILGLSLPLLSQKTGKLFLEGDRLIGNCEGRYYTGFEIVFDTIYSKIDSTLLFEELPTHGFVIFKDTIKVEAEYVVTERAGFPQVMFKVKSTWLTFDSLIVGENYISFNLDTDPEVPIVKSDVKIIRKAKELLSDAANWQQDDDRNCVDDFENNKYSLFCVLQQASIEVVGEYNHRNAVMQAVRHLINDKYPERKWAHRLKDFNNMPETTFDTIIEIMNHMEEKFVTELEK